LWNAFGCGGKNQQTGQRIDDHRDQEQHEREFNQGLNIKVVSDLLIETTLPMTMVTAMVSPKARARARKIDPMIPRRA